MGEGESERWGSGCGDSWRREEVDEGKNRTEGDRARLELVGVGWAYGPAREVCWPRCGWPRWAGARVGLGRPSWSLCSLSLSL